MANVKISVIIPVYNSQETLRECMSAILESSYKEYELIVIDNNSTDNSINIAKEFPCRLIMLDTNKGASGARNRGASEAQSDYLLFIDSDIIVSPDSISRIIDKLLEDGSVAGVSGTYAAYNRFNNFLSQYKHLVACYRDRMCEDLNQDSFRGAFLAVKKDVFTRVKFDELLKGASIEDIEFGRELISMGYRFILDKSIEVEHIKRFTLISFLRNQYYRSADIAKSFLNRKSYKFYMQTERKNRYAKIYLLRVPLAYLLIFFSAALVFNRNRYIVFSLFLIIIISVVIEKGFLKFCFSKKGLVFVARCIPIYFFDGFISGLGVINGFISYIKERINRR